MTSMSHAMGATLSGAKIEIFIYSFFNLYFVPYTRDEGTEKFFSPSPVLIRWNWIRSRPNLQNFWKSFRASPDPPM